MQFVASNEHLRHGRRCGRFEPTRLLCSSWPQPFCQGWGLFTGSALGEDPTLSLIVAVARLSTESGALLSRE